MLTGSKSTFKVRQMLPDIKERMLSQSGMNARSRDVFGLRCLPGECVLQRAVMVRKKLTAREGRGWLSGTLFCTHFRVAFVPQDAPKPDDNADPVLLGDHDVALASIEKVVVVGPNRTKLVTPNSSLKFTPEELVLYCRDLRVICFLFDRLTPDVQVIEMTHTIAKTYQPLKPGSVLSFQNAALGSVEMKQFLSNRRRDAHMNWYESASDWEQEVERCGATGWRVSSVNDRFEMSTSLPRFLVVPQKVLDTELKKSFAHFNDGRIPRWCWRHPRGSDLLRMSSFQNNIYHEKDDIRNLELILFGCQSSLCVVVELGEELPSPADIQLAHGRLRALCLGDISTSVTVPDDKWLSTLEGTRWLDYTRSCLKKASEVACLLRSGHMTVALQEAEDRDMSCVVSSLVQVMCDPHCRTQRGFQNLVQKEWVMAGHRFYSRINYHRDNDKEEAPVFLLFLDCVWQLWSQYPSRFQLTDDFLLALHDSTHLPLFSSFLGNCQRERCRRSQNLGQSYTPVNGWRDPHHSDCTSEPPDPPLPPVWDWSLQYSKQRQARFTQPVPATLPLRPLLNGNLNTHPDTHRLADAIPGSVFLLSRGVFSCPANLLPWRCGGGSSSGVYRKSHRRALSSENVPGLERLLKAWSLTEAPSVLTSNSGLHGPLDPYEPLLPLLMGPCMGLWRECYHRGALHAQAFSHPISANHPHPVERLAQEVQQLKDQLAEATSNTHPDPSARKTTNEPRRAANLNQNTNNGTFLFPASRPQGVGVATRAAALPDSLNHNTTRAPHTPPAAAAAAAAAPPSRTASRDNGNKHTFLFGHASATEARPGRGNPKVAKSNGASISS
ncbi:myotubularin-related protein 11 isoform X1 [Dunckerocampus dactyliophorus]|uniref:myotubularin-related protein 11 isoform X1 n=2 Tax=Dunckerocampus dactyliophorus TaxID=161453 RepID=UPI002404CDC1|nr:myotubularin-related protein 11 isoform X1 [Dunckerocampus dactyliophorus]XP_054637006.1 myotubularin-related protein 11 isoform X1 [Dunckerocampus dactyliophorus]